MTDLERHDGVAGALAQRVRQYAANRHSLFEWIHEDWLHSGFQVGPHTAPQAGWHDALYAAAPRDPVPAGQRREVRMVDAWLRAAGLATPPLDAFRGDPGALAALPVELALPALRMRALHFRRAELRYWIDRSSRERLAGWLGDASSGALRWLMDMPHAPQLDRLMRACGMPALDALDDEALAWEGFCLCLRAGWCSPRSPLALLRFALPRELKVPDWLDDAGAAAGINDGAAVMRRLSDFFEEQT
jgi:hypothetical protein